MLWNAVKSYSNRKKAQGKTEQKSKKRAEKEIEIRTRNYIEAPTIGITKILQIPYNMGLKYQHSP